MHINNEIDLAHTAIYACTALSQYQFFIEHP